MMSFLSKSKSPVVAFQRHKVFSVEDGMNMDDQRYQDNEVFESPLKAVAFNFRFNQFIGVFPSKISPDFMVLELKPIRFLWTAGVKLFTWSLISIVIFFWLTERGQTFDEFFDMAMNYKYFSNTDYFAIISHYLFLQLSAYFLFFNNLTLCSQLTTLNSVLRDLTKTIRTQSNHRIANPNVTPLISYRLFVCFLCTVASIFFLIGLHELIKMPGDDTKLGYGVAVIILMAIALYNENQNHMFSELLFLRYVHVLKHHCDHLLIHLRSVHPEGYGCRSCCYKRADILHEMYASINKTFGNDIFATIAILVISTVFGGYLLMTFTVFTGGKKFWSFIAAYTLYTIIPSMRLYVLVEGSEWIRRQLKEIKRELDNLEAEMIWSEETTRGQIARLRKVMKKFQFNPGFSASGYFNLSRDIIASLVGSLFTYLIVLLQFKAAER